jgi:HEAT repeat protein
MEGIDIDSVATISLAAEVAIRLSIIVFLLIVIIMAYIFVLRIILVVGGYFRSRFTSRWTQYLIDGLIDPSFKLPSISYIKFSEFLVLWNTFHSNYKNDPAKRSRLNELVVNRGIEKRAKILLGKRGLKRKLLGIMTLGNLKAINYWQEISQYAMSHNPMLSLVTVEALFLIDANAAINIFIDQVGSRDDWPPTMAASILTEAGTEVVSAPIVSAVLFEAESRTKRLIPYLNCCDPAMARGAARQSLLSTDSDHITGLCLKVLSQYGIQDDLDIIRQYSEHDRWHIRAQAARALGRIGTREDQTRLVNLLHDTQWWVRYRAAQALASLPFLELEALEKLRDEQTDRYGRDMLSHVIAEKVLAENNDTA